MAVKQVKFNDTFIYINDDVYDEELKSMVDNDELDKTKVIEVIDEDMMNDDTSVDTLLESNE